MDGQPKSSPSPLWAKAQRITRLWVFLLTLLTGLSVIVYYILYSRLNLFQLAYGSLSWQDIAIMVFSLVNFITYSYALCGKPGTKPDLRAFLIFSVAIFYLYLTFRSLNISSISWSQSFPVNSGDSSTAPRSIEVEGYICQPAIPACVMYFVTAWLMLITGLSMILEIVLTLKVGPMRSQGQYGRDGYKNEANVIVVSPEVPQGMFFNQQFQPQPPMTMNTTQQMYNYPHNTGFVPTAPAGYKLEAPTHLIEASQQSPSQSQPQPPQQPQQQQQQLGHNQIPYPTAHTPSAFTPSAFSSQSQSQSTPLSSTGGISPQPASSST